MGKSERVSAARNVQLDKCSVKRGPTRNPSQGARASLSVDSAAGTRIRPCAGRGHALAAERRPAAGDLPSDGRRDIRRESFGTADAPCTISDPSRSGTTDLRILSAELMESGHQ